MKTTDLIAEAISLPVEERALMVESLLQTLNAPETDLDAAWLVVARRRLDELRSGTVATVPGEAVFERLMRRFGA